MRTQAVETPRRIGAEEPRSAHVAQPEPALFERLLCHIRPDTACPLTRIASLDASQALVEQAIRQISRIYVDSVITVQPVDLDRVVPLSFIIDPERSVRVARYLRLLRRRHILPYSASAVRFRGERTYQLALPPLVEEHGDTYVVVDGVHRLKLLIDASEDTAICVVVSGNLPAPPSEPAKWSEVRYGPDKYISRAKKFRAFNRPLFRPAGDYLRSRAFEYSSLRDIAS